MSDFKSEIDSDAEPNYSINANADPKNVQELTIYVSIKDFGRCICLHRKIIVKFFV